MIDQSKKYDVFGIGNAMMDFLIEVEHDMLDQLNLKKGEFKGIDEEEMKLIFDKIEMKKFQRMPGGSTANIIYGIAQLGGDVIFCGKTGKGEQGMYYEEKLTSAGVIPRIAKSDSMTGRAFTFITPDSERSFACFQGAALDFAKEDIFEKDIKDSKIVHIEGYQLQSSSIRDIALHTLDLATKHNVPVSVDLNDAGLIRKNHEYIKEIVKDHVNILFANEDEAEAFTGTRDIYQAMDIMSKYSDITIIKNGPKGSYIRYNGISQNIPSYKARTVDTTGAGDMYAAGFLFGLTKGYDIETAGKIGSLAASKVVENIGPRYDGDLKGQIDDFLDKA